MSFNPEPLSLKFSCPVLEVLCWLIALYLLTLLTCCDVSWGRDCPNREFKHLSVTKREAKPIYAFLWTFKNTCTTFRFYGCLMGPPLQMLLLSSLFSTWTSLVKSITFPGWHYLGHANLNEPEPRWCPGFRTRLEYGHCWVSPRLHSQCKWWGTLHKPELFPQFCSAVLESLMKHTWGILNWKSFSNLFLCASDLLMLNLFCVFYMCILICTLLEHWLSSTISYLYVLGKVLCVSVNQISPL